LLRAPLLDRFRLNDGIGYAGAFVGGGVTSGKHDLHDYGAGVGIMSPSTLRYMSILARLQREFGTEWRGWRVCEIGGGYGGQAHIVLAANPLIHSYTIYDQPAPAALQARYLAAMGWPGSIVRAKSVVCAEDEGAAPQPADGAEAADESEKNGKVTGKVAGKLTAAGDVVAPARCTIEGDLGEGEPDLCDLVLSNYALTELSAAVQAFYAERVLGGARVGAYIEGIARNLYVRDRFTHHRVGARPARGGGAEEAVAGDWLQLVEEVPGLPPTTTATALLFDSNVRMSRFVFRRQS
jgi:hypothetical protein